MLTNFDKLGLFFAAACFGALAGYLARLADVDRLWSYVIGLAIWLVFYGIEYVTMRRLTR